MSNDHGCLITWCDQGAFANEPHWATISYTPATMGWVKPEDVGPEGVRTPVVGIGLRWDEDRGMPAVLLHVGGDTDDIEVYLRIDEAESVLGALQDACDLVRETLAGGHRAGGQSS